MEEKTLGKTTIAPNVLTTIVRLTALGTPGVTRLARVTGKGSSLEQESEGVKIDYRGETIMIDVFVVISASENVRLVAEEIQKRIIRAIAEMVGLQVMQVDVHIADVDIES